MPLATCRVVRRRPRWPSTAMVNPYESSDEHRPVTWVQGYPIYAAHLVVLGFVVSMFATTIALAAKADALLAWLPFTSDAVLRGQVWRVLTYGLVNPPSLGFVIDMAMIGWFGREVERVYGRNAFLGLYGCLYLLAPLVFTVLGPWLPAALSGESGAFALFVAFAVIYPNVMMLFNVPAKWMAVIFAALYALTALGRRDWPGLITLGATVGFAVGFVRWKQGRLDLTLPRIEWLEKKPKLRVLPDLPKKEPVTTAVRTAEPRRSEPVKPRALAPEATSEVDALLDKIAQSGINSLTAKERARLELARAELLKRR